MKVLMLNGSSNLKGNTFLALEMVGKQLNKEGVDYEIFQVGAKPIKDCGGCGKCSNHKCLFGEEDGVNEFIKKAESADGFVFGTPVYYAHPSGRILSFLDRAFWVGYDAFMLKPGASIAVCRRGGASASFDAMNKYFGISNMITVGSTYWNIIHGRDKGEVTKDDEGIQTMENIARNMAWVMKCMEVGKKEGVELPKLDHSHKTNFIR